MSGKRLSTLNIFALGFMTFALFVGAGNIIFPPMVGLQSGQHVFIAAIGFLITGVGLPVLTIVALAKVGGGLEHLSAPIGKVAALILAIVCYLAVGPLFATPRTATVSFEVGIAPLTGSSHFALLIYSIIYFVIVCIVALYPGKLLDIVGRFLAPIKMLALAILAIAAIFWPAGHSIPAIATYQVSPFSNGFVNGYLTMDTLGALVFGIVIVNAARSKEVTSPNLLTRYAIYAAIIAGVALMLIYVCLFRLGSGSGSLIPNAINGAQILHAYVQYTFGDIGSIFLAVLIFLACIVTAIGLTCACAEFFSQYVPLNYPSLVIILAFFSMVVSNLGLSQLISFSVPVLTAIYPPCIILIILSFMHRLWIKPNFVIAPVALMSFIFGIVDGINASELHDVLPKWIAHLPLFQQGLAWLIPSVVVLVIMMFCHKLKFSALQHR